MDSVRQEFNRTRRLAGGCPGSRRFWSRRDFLWQLGGGLGAIALTDLLQEDGRLLAGVLGEAKARTHHPAKARRVIQLFMSCGVSQVDSFDYKPALEKVDGEDVGKIAGIENLFFGKPGRWMRSPFRFQRCGESGKWVSELFPHIGREVDQIAFVHSMQAVSNSHGPACFQMNTGFIRPGYPSVGAWTVYGLGRETDNLPAHVVLIDRGLPPGHHANWGAGFLPSEHQGVMLQPTGDPILDLNPPPGTSPDAQRASFELLAKLNAEHLAKNPGDSDLAARIAAYEMAAKMQLSAPEVTDLTQETESVKRLYGLDRSDPEQATFARNVLLARRLIERGVRYVSVYCGGPNMPTGKYNWDGHDDIVENHRRNAAIADKPIGALLADLAQRGMLDDTLVVWTMEFGRTPMRQGDSKGRDHNPLGFTVWLAGAGLKGGSTHGATDEFGYAAVENPTTIYDLHATILHLLGFDHTRLTYYHNGRQQRLTDVHGELLSPILA
jgi:hypothetical protein